MQILLTGGSACGKSKYAERLVTLFPEPRYYLATMKIYDKESEKKVSRHKELRKHKNFLTIEKQTDLNLIDLPQNSTVLLECICNLTANEMFDADDNFKNPKEKILSNIEELSKKCANLIIVTNDVGSDGDDYDETTKQYIKILGEINNELAKKSDHVYELVCSIPIVIKGSLL